MRWDVFLWAAVALLLMAAETMAPGAFMLWLGFAAAAVFVGVLLVPGIPVLAQVAAFVVLSFISIQVYRKWFRSREPQSDRPALNRRSAALVRSEEHTSELQSLMRISYAVFCLKKKKQYRTATTRHTMKK